VTARSEAASSTVPPARVWSRNYSLFILGLVVSNIGTWAQRVAQSWLVLDISGGSGAALGITTGLQFLPVLLLGAWGGVVVDRLPRRKLVAASQAGMGLLALVLATLTAADLVRIWHIYLLAFLLGLLNVFDNPGRNAMLGEVVGSDGLPRAVALNAALFNVSRMVGPSLGGILIATVGTAATFFINALSFVVVLVSLALMRASEMLPSPVVPRVSGMLREGIRFVAGRHELLLAMTVAGLTNTFAMNFQVTIALMSRQALGLPASSYGVLFSAVGAGSIAGALLAAWHARPRLRIVVFAAIGLGLLEIVSATVTSFWVFFALLLVTGAMSLSVSISTQAIVQQGATPDLRGRVMALYYMSIGGIKPVGGPALGLVATAFGPRWCMAAGGGVAIVVGTVAAGYLVVRCVRAGARPLAL
jgi:MFS family permease